MNKFFTFILTFTFLSIFAQTKQYRAEYDKLNDLIHTKLKVDFNFDNSTMNGEEWLTFKPHFYPQKTLVLDAKAMLIHKVTIDDKPLKYEYNKLKLIINLPRIYNKNESETIYIKYTAQPEKVKQKGSAAITSAKGLYFINPKGKEKNKPTQIWTQGETESSSCWFPTIDSPNQKTSEEIYITVPNKYKTLSNGKLESQKINSNGTRTDYWVFNKKHAPYLFFMGIGDFEIIKDKYKDIPVNYYVEKKYAPYAKDIFGNTPEMMAFYSKITGIEYPWNKYSQLVARDYVSGAMENTTAVIHGEQAYQVPGQLIDKNIFENTIAHELFHHWFGDLVTTESWSNLTLNESFANYGEYLWLEHKYGKDYADAHLFDDTNLYKSSNSFDKNLVRFYYNNKEDMFDLVSYNKGGAILHMLRKYIGDDAFFASINKYLTDNKYKAAEVHQWRLAIEDVTGKDLNWFFNQWYFGSGNPKLDISYDYNKILKEVTVNIQQNQKKKFIFPLAIDVYEGNVVTRHNVFVKEKKSSFTFKYKKQPNLVLVNADGVLLCDINDNKDLNQYIFQLNHVKNYKYKRKALLEVSKNQENKKAFEAIVKAMDDPFYKIRKLALEKINLINKNHKKNVIKKIKQIAKNDPKTIVQSSAIETLGKLTDKKLKSIFKKGLHSKSFSVIGKSLVALYYIDKDLALSESKKLPKEVKKNIATPLTRIYLEEDVNFNKTDLEFIAKNILGGMFLTPDKKIKSLYKKAFTKISKSNNTKAIENLTKDIVYTGKKYKKYGFNNIGIQLMKQMIKNQEEANQTNKENNLDIIKKAIEELLK